MQYDGAYPIVLCAHCGVDISWPVLQYGTQLWPVSPQYCVRCWLGFEKVKEIEAEQVRLRRQISEINWEIHALEDELFEIEEQVAELEIEAKKLRPVRELVYSNPDQPVLSVSLVEAFVVKRT